jgi:ankyrin repeat protein
VTSRAASGGARRSGCPPLSLLALIVLFAIATPGIAGPLHDAAKAGDAPALQRHLDAGMKADERDSNGVTPLMEASWYGREEAVKLLISRNADVNALSARGGTALMEASFKGYTGVAKILIDSGARVNARNDNGVTALMWAASKGYPETVKLLIRAKADVRLSSFRHTDPETYTTVMGKTALAYAAGKGHLDIARMLLDAGAEADIDCGSISCASGDEGALKTPLLYAASAGKTDMITLLVRRKARVNPQCDSKCLSSETPLIAASLGGNPAAVRLLLKLGAKVDARGSAEPAYLRPPRPADREATALMHLLFHRGLQQHSGPGKDETAAIAKLLVNAGANVKFTMQCTGPGVSPRVITSLGLGVMTGRAEIASMLLKKGAAVNPPGRPAAGETPSGAADVMPLGLAAAAGRTDIAGLLIRKGAAVDARDTIYGETASDYATIVDRLTPLHLAARFGHARMVRLLLKHRADVHAQSDRGATALILAMPPLPADQSRAKAELKSRTEIVKLLIAKGADVHAKDRDGASALESARRNAYREAEKALTRAGARE